MNNEILNKIDWNILNKYIDTDLITANKHPEYDLYLLNYTHHVKLENKWDLYTRSCRGLVVDIAGKIIKAKATTLLNWDADITERSTEAKIRQKPWNRFCILDIVILDVARELRQRGLSHKQMVALCKWLKMKFVDRQVIINFSMGRSLLIIYDFASVRLVTKQKGTNVVRIGTIKTSLLIVSLHLAIRKILKNRILRKLYDSDFRVKFSISNKAIYIIEGKKITLTDIPPEPDEDTAEALLSKIHDRL